MNGYRQFILILGGARSGKSAFAERLAAAMPGPVAYLATATAGDDEMRRRIAAHRQARPVDWRTVEEPIDLAGALRNAAGARTILIDCLTLWVSNILLAAPPPSHSPSVGASQGEDDPTSRLPSNPLPVGEGRGEGPGNQPPPVVGAARPQQDVPDRSTSGDVAVGAVEREVDRCLDDFLAAYEAGEASVIAVSNEVGLGLVPPYPLGRLYRDVLGRVNQRLAARADAVYLMVAGLPVDVKALAATIGPHPRPLSRQRARGGEG